MGKYLPQPDYVAHDDVKFVYIIDILYYKL